LAAEAAVLMSDVRYIAKSVDFTTIPREFQSDKFDVIIPRGSCKGRGGTGGMSSEAADIDIMKLVRVLELLTEFERLRHLLTDRKPALD
jgi:hypothetical protein